jgi:toxin ParE1/3/4
MPSLSPIFLPAFRSDIQDVVMWSENHFGTAAADRYALLISQALIDVQANPTRPGAKSRPDLAPHAYTYHLRYSRDRVAGKAVKAPRHFILYRVVDGSIEFARLLRDSSDVTRHLPSGYRAEE